MINVGELIYDPDFCQTITVKRTKCSIVNHRASYVESTFQVTAVVTIADVKTLEMLPEADKLSGAINVFTENELYVTSNREESAYISDIVYFEGKTFKVANTLGDMQYGFCRSVCVLIERS